MSAHDFKNIDYWRAMAEHNGAAWEACQERWRRAEDELAGLRKLHADLQARLDAMKEEACDGDPVR